MSDAEASPHKTRLHQANLHRNNNRDGVSPFAPPRRSAKWGIGDVVIDATPGLTMKGLFLLTHISLFAIVACTAPQQSAAVAARRSERALARSRAGRGSGGWLGRQYNSSVRRDVWWYLQPQRQCGWHRTKEQ
jgi:hypothetical protein